MAEWSIAVVLKTIGCNSPGGSNPSLSAFKIKFNLLTQVFFYLGHNVCVLKLLYIIDNPLKVLFFVISSFLSKLISKIKFLKKT